MFVLDTSIALAWFLPDERSEVSERLLAKLRTSSAHAPSLFWFEMRNTLVVAERRKRLADDSAERVMGRLRRLSIVDEGQGSDGPIIDLARRHALSGYDASYLALAVRKGLPLATDDGRLRTAARAESIEVLGTIDV